MLRLYLAHPLLTRKWVRKAELKAEKELNIELINPFYDEVEGLELPAKLLCNGETTIIKQLDGGKISREEYIKLLDPDIITTSDLGKIDISDGIVGVVSGCKSIGTICEATYSKMNEKIVHLLVYEESLRSHPWLDWLSDGMIFKDFNEWKKWMNAKPKNIHTTEY